MSINTVTLMGRIGSDPVVREAGQTKVAQFSLATGGKFTTKDGREMDDTAWHSIVAWRGLAEISEKYIHKGSQVLVIGHLSYRKYTDNNGVEKYITEIVADKIELCGSRSEGQQSQQSQPVQQKFNPHSVKTSPMPYPTEDGPTDDLPFN
jgi:single-strand DNA-binding protein